MDKYNKAINKILSFGVRTAIGYIPVVGPVISSGLGEIESHIRDHNDAKVTSDIINRLKNDRNNLIPIYSHNLQIINEAIHYSDDLDLISWCDKYLDKSEQLNLTEKMYAFSFKLLHEHVQVAKHSQDEKIKIYEFLYEFVCECEAEVWVENDLRAHLYHSISLFLSRRLNEYSAAILFSIKSIEEANNPYTRLAYFMEGYLFSWVNSIAELLNKTKDDLVQLNILERYWNTINSTIIAIENYSESEKNPPLYKNSTFSSVTHILIGKNTNLQINFLISCAVSVLKVVPAYIDFLVELSDKFYATYEILNEEEACLLESHSRNETKRYYDELFQIH